ncbi:CPBP family intramembrane glutamic endopeptidase [Moraxella sp. ZY210820]|uniref:CPBP family intramembrane glutamic endopeptidase n=1 Tax=unclassified Moraxella TaxID=2685852 RepID=UPI00272F3459|nr:CPBP family intramembrane glutamic endopeptidase [Moraxella sp. ZY210820]WLF84057.1 CPBP family intramembrane metalloprotease [Moraxella sp. ZY210820]
MYSLKNDKEISHLNLIDIAILTCIFFGHAIYDSTVQYFSLHAQQLVMPEQLSFTPDLNIWGITSEIAALVLAFIYLKLRKFDFNSLNFKFSLTTPLKILLYILIAGTVATCYEYVHAWLYPAHYPDMTATTEYYTAEQHLSQMSWSLMLFALLNGFFEELFFLGLIFAVNKKYLPYVILFSLLIRFAFHTYQGIAGAMTITTLGIVFALLRYKYDDLPAFMLAHSFFDIFGLGLPLYLLDLE